MYGPQSGKSVGHVLCMDETRSQQLAGTPSEAFQARLGPKGGLSGRPTGALEGAY